MPDRFNSSFEHFSGLQAVNDALNAAGIPYTGTSVVPVPIGRQSNYSNPSGDWFIVISFTDSATPAQIAQAEAIVAATDKRPRLPKTQAEQITDLGKLKQADKDTILLALVADRLATDPNFIQRLGIPYKGDKDPTGQA